MRYPDVGSDAIDRAVIVAAPASSPSTSSMRGPRRSPGGMALHRGESGPPTGAVARRAPATSSAAIRNSCRGFVSVMYKLTGAHSAVSCRSTSLRCTASIVLLAAWFLARGGQRCRAAARHAGLAGRACGSRVDSVPRARRRRNCRRAGLRARHDAAGAVLRAPARHLARAARIRSSSAPQHSPHLHEVDGRHRAPVAGRARSGRTHDVSALGRSGRPRSGATVQPALGIAAAGHAAVRVEQGASELRIGRWEPDPFEVNISLRQIPDAALDRRQRRLSRRRRGRPRRAGPAAVLEQLRRARLAATGLHGMLSICLLASLVTWFGRATLPVLLATARSGCYWSSYDQRNIFGLLPALALAVSFGGAWLWRARPQLDLDQRDRSGWRTFPVLAGGGLLKDAQATIASMTRGERALPARSKAMRGAIGRQSRALLSSPRSRITASFPALAAAPMRRTCSSPTRCSASSSAAPTRSASGRSIGFGAGDVFAGHEYHAPPADPRWVLLSRSPAIASGSTARRWNFGDAVSSPREPAAAVARRILYRRGARDDLGDSGLVVWRAAGAGNAGSEPPSSNT